MRLKNLLEGIGVVQISGEHAIDITGIEHDSRRVAPGHLFVAIRGRRHDGRDYIEAAATAGAAAVASEDAPGPDMPVRAWLQVKDCRRFMPLAAANFYRQQTAGVALVGVTGTNGKSTVAFIIDAVWRSSGLKSGLIGTVYYSLCGKQRRAERTTPESPDIHRFLADLKQCGGDRCVMEVSSHALAMNRVLGCRFQAAVFTNLSRDHMDFHRSMDRYFDTKKELFSLLAREGVAVVNTDDPHGQKLADSLKGRVVSFGIDSTADYQPVSSRLSPRGIEARIKTPGGVLNIHSSLLGRPNLYNILAATATCCETGIPLPDIAHGIRKMEGVPGRFERVDAGQDFLVMVDFAHTDAALRNLLSAVRAITDGRLITVFGCGGDRDKGKRPLMGAAAAGWSDITIVTSDNPRSEDPLEIISQVLQGIEGDRGKEDRVLVIPDRREAIGKAMTLAASGDAVVIAGKGHETGQILKDRTVPFDDREEAKKALRRIWRA
jgi:UDP-N-acetylmuramoyl-L-alanyl-D-glutamate--2,6-diaminopimelate ligase